MQSSQLEIKNSVEAKCLICGKVKQLRYRNVCDACYMRLYRARKREERRTIRKIFRITIAITTAVSIFLLWFIYKLVIR